MLVEFELLFRGEFFNNDICTLYNSKTYPVLSFLSVMFQLTTVLAHRHNDSYYNTNTKHQENPCHPLQR